MRKIVSPDKLNNDIYQPLKQPLKAGDYWKVGDFWKVQVQLNQDGLEINRFFIPLSVLKIHPKSIPSILPILQIMLNLAS
jgi:hypothetical protein